MVFHDRGYQRAKYVANLQLPSNGSEISLKVNFPEISCFVVYWKRREKQVVYLGGTYPSWCALPETASMFFLFFLLCVSFKHRRKYYPINHHSLCKKNRMLQYFLVHQNVLKLLFRIFFLYHDRNTNDLATITTFKWRSGSFRVAYFQI